MSRRRCLCFSSTSVETGDVVARGCRHRLRNRYGGAAFAIDSRPPIGRARSPYASLASVPALRGVRDGFGGCGASGRPGARFRRCVAAVSAASAIPANHARLVAISTVTAATASTRIGDSAIRRVARHRNGNSGVSRRARSAEARWHCASSARCAICANDLDRQRMRDRSEECDRHDREAD